MSYLTTLITFIPLITLVSCSSDINVEVKKNAGQIVLDTTLENGKPTTEMALLATGQYITISDYVEVMSTIEISRRLYNEGYKEDFYLRINGGRGVSEEISENKKARKFTITAQGGKKTAGLTIINDVFYVSLFPKELGNNITEGPGLNYIILNYPSTN